MSVATVLRFVQVFRDHGVPVTFQAGWETRGNGQSSAYEGGIVHHTASPYSNSSPSVLVAGRPNLAGPLCNFAGLSGGGIHVIAAQPANHAGASGGRSMGPLPVTTTFNRRVLGLEIVYPGTSPMTEAQLRTAKVFAKAVREVFGTTERCRAHAETSITGKWDPGYAPDRTIDMTAFRRETVAASGDELDMTPEELQKHVYTAVRNLYIDMNNGHEPASPGAFIGLVRKGAPAVDTDAIVSAIRADVVNTVRESVGQVQAEEVGDRVVARLQGLTFKAI